MKRILTAAQMKAADTATIENGVPSLVLMERAALSVVQTLMHRRDRFDLTHVGIFCGIGNNAGDGVAMGRILMDYGFKATLILVGPEEKYSEAMKTQVLAAKNRSVPMIHFEDSEGEKRARILRHCKFTLLVDALFGIGLKRAIAGSFADAIDWMNASPLPKVAVDIASGIHTDTGAVMGTALQCDLTVTFARAKRGMLLNPGAQYSGEILVKEIGIPVDEGKAGEDLLFNCGLEDLKLLPERNESGNKGSFKKLLVIAGSKDIFGAAALCAEAALRSGAGMVKVFTEESNRTALCARVPEALMSFYLAEGDGGCMPKIDLSWADGIVIGPGLGTSAISESILETVLDWNKDQKLPTVFDADALNLLAKHPSYYEKISFPSVFTPHMGEMSRLTGKSIQELKADPIRHAEAFAKEKGITLVMKDARTVIALKEGISYLNTSGNSALSTAGSGDVLAGILGTLFTQNPEIPEIAALSVLIHGTAGEHASKKGSKAGVTATDLIKELPELMPC